MFKSFLMLLEGEDFDVGWCLGWKAATARFLDLAAPPQCLLSLLGVAVVLGALLCSPDVLHKILDEFFLVHVEVDLVNALEVLEEVSLLHEVVSADRASERLVALVVAQVVLQVVLLSEHCLAAGMRTNKDVINAICGFVHHRKGVELRIHSFEAAVAGTDNRRHLPQHLLVGSDTILYHLNNYPVFESWLWPFCLRWCLHKPLGCCIWETEYHRNPVTLAFSLGILAPASPLLEGSKDQAWKLTACPGVEFASHSHLKLKTWVYFFGCSCLQMIHGFL